MRDRAEVQRERAFGFERFDRVVRNTVALHRGIDSDQVLVVGLGTRNPIRIAVREAGETWSRFEVVGDDETDAALAETAAYLENTQYDNERWTQQSLGA